MLVGAELARAHVQDLVAGGMGIRAVATRSGVPRSTVERVLKGTQHRVHVDTERRLLEIRLADRPDSALVPAAATHELVTAMVDAGRSHAWIARQLGLKTPALQLGDEWVTVGRARAIEELAGAVLGQPPNLAEGDVDEDDDLAVLQAMARALGMLDDSWMPDAACTGNVNPAAFFAEDPVLVRQLVAFCEHCPVRQPCLEYALATGDAGVWGGTTTEERSSMRAEGVTAA